MSSSSYYWSHNLISGFGKMWFLIAPQKAISSGGGESLLGSVVNEVNGSLLPSGGGVFGKDFPEPIHLTTPQLILNAIKQNRKAMGIPDQDEIVQEVDYSALSISVDKRNILKASAGGFPSLPVSLGIDYSRAAKITINFGAGTRRRYIPTGYLSLLKKFVKGDDSKIASHINIDKETIVHQILLSRNYTVTFESTQAFQTGFDAAIAQANIDNAGKISFKLDKTTRKQVSVNINDGNEYLIALKDIDWDDF
jgi:hypothetical protein